MLPNMKPEDIEYENNCVKIAHFFVNEKPDLEVRTPQEVLDTQTSSISSDLFRFGHIIWVAIAGANLLYTTEDYINALKSKDEKSFYNLIDKKLQTFVVAAKIRDLLINLLTLDPQNRKENNTCKMNISRVGHEASGGEPKPTNGRLQSRTRVDLITTSFGGTELNMLPHFNSHPLVPSLNILVFVLQGDRGCDEDVNNIANP
ncbi:hypothetical protein OROGR_027338 [Orobanche gracilis]